MKRSPEEMAESKAKIKRIVEAGREGPEALQKVLDELFPETQPKPPQNPQK